jgi:nucleoside 2-deoxyribosyltransferase
MKLLVSARLIIANIDGRNPNVFYELGIAHALDKPVIIISRNIPDIAFDIKGMRMILYKNHRELKRDLLYEITKILTKK